MEKCFSAIRMLIWDTKALPVPVTKVVSINSYGSSTWSKPAKVVARLSHLSIATYFLKVCCRILCSFVVLTLEGYDMRK